jgi:hypothetical protein
MSSTKNNRHFPFLRLKLYELDRPGITPLVPQAKTDSYTNYKIIWNSTGTEVVGCDRHGSFFLPISPPGFTPLSCIGTNVSHHTSGDCKEKGYIKENSTMLKDRYVWFISTNPQFSCNTILDKVIWSYTGTSTYTVDICKMIPDPNFPNHENYRIMGFFARGGVRSGTPTDSYWSQNTLLQCRAVNKNYLLEIDVDKGPYKLENDLIEPNNEATYTFTAYDMGKGHAGFVANMTTVASLNYDNASYANTQYVVFKGGVDVLQNGVKPIDLGQKVYVPLTQQDAIDCCMGKRKKELCGTETSDSSYFTYSNQCLSYMKGYCAQNPDDIKCKCINKDYLPEKYKPFQESVANIDCLNPNCGLVNANEVFIPDSVKRLVQTGCEINICEALASFSGDVVVAGELKQELNCTNDNKPVTVTPPSPPSTSSQPLETWVIIVIIVGVLIILGFLIWLIYYFATRTENVENVESVESVESVNPVEP